MNCLRMFHYTYLRQPREDRVDALLIFLKLRALEAPPLLRVERDLRRLGHGLDGGRALPLRNVLEPFRREDLGLTCFGRELLERVLFRGNPTNDLRQVGRCLLYTSPSPRD